MHAHICLFTRSIATSKACALGGDGSNGVHDDAAADPARLMRHNSLHEIEVCFRYSVCVCRVLCIHLCAAAYLGVCATVRRRVVFVYVCVYVYAPSTNAVVRTHRLGRTTATPNNTRARSD